jgi:SAM-dependent methyltransferase
LDLTPDLLAVGAARLRDSGVRNVLLLEGSAAALPFVDASFDVVFCRSALHHFRSPRATIKEMARVCRSQGRVVVMDMVAPSPALRGAFDELHRLIDPSHMEVLLSDEIVGLLASEVGPVCHAEVVGPSRLPIDQILTDASDRESVKAALARELNGEGASGFAPHLESSSDPGQERMSVSFTSVIVHAAKPPPP